MPMQEQRDAHEASLDRLHRRLRTLCQCTMTFFQAESEQELLQSVCEILVAGGEVRLAWIGYCEDDAEKTVRPVAQAGSGLDYLERVKTSWGEIETDQGPPGIAARTGKASWVDDLRTDLRFSPWRVAALARGYASCIAVPLIAHSTQRGAVDLRGTLNLYSAECNVFDEGAVEHYTGLATSVVHAVTALRGHLAEDLAYGVTALRARAERKQAEEALHQAREELAHVTRVTTLGELAASVAHRPCDLAGVIRDVLLLVGPELGRHGTVLQTSLATDLPPVMGDRVQLQQVLLNLLLNAAEAVRNVPPERRRLVVRSTLERRDDGSWAVVAVEDAGVGFREEQAARLFEAFYTTKPGGLGMGLSISRSIMDGHRGRLWATANSGHGATFHFALPGIR